MRNDKYILEPLFEKAESYAKTSYELYKLKTINKSLRIISSFVSGGITLILFYIFIFILSIGVALWLGELLGKLYYGFFCVAAFYGLVTGIVYLFMQKFIKKRVSNSIISHLLD